MDPKMGSRKGALLKERLEMEKYWTAEGRKRFTIKPFEEELSFDKGFFVFIRAIQLLTSHNEGTVVVGLAGPSGSGKTAFSEKVRSFMPGVCLISMDNYNDGSKVIDSNFDDPRLTDYDLLLQNVADLQEGKTIQMPIYDFKQSKRVGYKEVQVPPSRVVIIEGIYALSEQLRQFLDLRVSITGGIHFDLVKRVLRDLNRSGLQADEIIQQVSDTVYPMYKAFIEPDLKTAQLKVYNNFNPFSGFICNPIYILKSKNALSKEEMLSVLDESKVEVSETELVDIYLLPPNEDPEQCTSWLRMRSRDGRYSLMFEEWVTEVPFVISPRISFEVSSRILGGLLALGYEIGPILKRNTVVHSDGELSIKQDKIEKLGKFVQIHGNDRTKVSEAGKKLGLEGTYIPRSYIEQVQLENLVAALKAADLTEHLGIEHSALPRQLSLDRDYPEGELGGNDGKQISNAASTGLGQQLRSAKSGSALGPLSIGGRSDDGGYGTKGLLHREFSTLKSSSNPDHDEMATSPASCTHSPQHSRQTRFRSSTRRSSDDRIEHHMSEMAKSMRFLANSFGRQNISIRELQYTILATGCVFFGVGALIGYKIGQK